MPEIGKLLVLSAALAVAAVMLVPAAGLAGEAALLWTAPSRNSDGSALADLAGYRVHYGAQYGVYPNILDVGNVTAFQVPGLSTGTYYFAVTAYNASGRESAYSNVAVKTIASDATAPAVSGVYAGDIQTSSARINWTTDEPATTHVEYGLTPSYGYSTALDGALTTAHIQDLTGLAPATAYNFRVISRDGPGNTAVSGNHTFTTAAPADTAPPAVSDIQVTGVTSGSAVVTWTTDEPASSQVDFGTGGSFTAATPLDTTLRTVHSASLEGLQSNTTYSFRVVSSDSAGNTAVSAPGAFATSNQAPVVNSFSATPLTGLMPLQVRFTAGVVDPDGFIAGYEWDFDGDGVYDHDSGPVPTATYTYQGVGTYAPRVKAKDNGGAVVVSEPLSVSVTSAVNNPPIIVSILGTVSQNGSGVSINYEVAASDPNGVIVKFEWDFDGNGTIDAVTTTAPATYTYSSSGTYYPVVKVTDNQGGTATASTSVDVPEAAAVSGPVSPAGSTKGACFIATAAYGSYLEPEVKVLRDFRDGVLLENPLGRSFVDFYYGVSPPAADFIARHQALRAAARVVLTPIVYIVKYPAPAVSIAFLAAGAALLGRRQRGRTR